MSNLRLALRTLWRAPGFTAAAVLVLAIGVGATTAVFSVVRAVVLRPLGVPRGEELVRLYERPSGLDVRWGYSTPDYLDVAKENGAFVSVAGIRAGRQTLTGRGTPAQIPVARVTSSFFSTLRVWPAIGRAVSAEEDLAGTERTAVLTDDFWRRELGGDPAAVGRTLVLDGRTYTIVGVMPREFHFPLLRQAEVLLSASFDADELKYRDHIWLDVVARLKPQLGQRAAQADLDVLAPRIDSRLGEHSGWRMEAQPLLDDLIGAVKPALSALFGAVILALLIACANVATLLLARGMARQRELAIRAALGGGRGDLVRHVLTEAVLLAAIGGALAVLLAPWAVSMLVALAPPDMPRLDEVRVDSAVLAFALAISVGAGIVAGLLPALQLTQPRLMDALKNGAGATASRARARTALVIGETALAFMLAAGAGLMIRTLSGLLEVPSGLGAPERVVIADLELPPARYPNGRILALSEQLMQRVGALPGVRSATLASNVPLQPRGRAEFGFTLEGETYPPGQGPKVEMVWATPGYLETLGIPLLRGRDLRWIDTTAAPHIVLVNEAFVRRYVPQGEPLGRHIVEILGPGNDPWTIAGVIADVHTKGLDLAPAPLVVVPLLQYQVPFLRVAARTAKGDPMQLVSAIRSEVLAIDKDLPVANAQPLSRIVAASVGGRRFQMTLMTAFALVALTLAALGIYGVLAYSVAQRSREIGIRMALGADASSVLRMVVAGGARLAVAGVVLGLFGAAIGTRVLGSLLYKVSATDPLTLGGTAAVLVGSALLASWVPARRATRVDPAVSLRVD